MKAKFLSPLLIALLGLTACGGSSTTSTTETTDTAHSTTTAHWSYEGTTGPTHWGSIAGNETCGTGQSQSPINITGATATDLTNIAFSYHSPAVTVIDNGHTVQANNEATDASKITVDGVDYNVLQFHFHSPSEHEVGGVLADAEFHIVHKAADGTLAVVGLLLKGGATENAAYKTVLEQFATTTGHENVEQTPGTAIDLNTLLPDAADRTTYRYTGSLTTPPCTEGVKWFVMTKFIDVSDAQITALKAHHDANNRPVNPLNSRTLEQDSTAAN